jgi:hypothetical protein
VGGRLALFGAKVPSAVESALLTEEIVSVPADALAFISIRTKTKFRGLVNVSSSPRQSGMSRAEATSSKKRPTITPSSRE